MCCKQTIDETGLTYFCSTNWATSRCREDRNRTCDTKSHIEVSDLCSTVCKERITRNVVKVNTKLVKSIELIFASLYNCFVSEEGVFFGGPQQHNKVQAQEGYDDRPAGCACRYIWCDDLQIWKRCQENACRNSKKNCWCPKSEMVETVWLTEACPVLGELFLYPFISRGVVWGYTTPLTGEWYFVCTKKYKYVSPMWAVEFLWL